MSAALFLDRDGTLIKHRPYLCDPSEVELVSGVRDALEWAVSLGYLLFLFTNQSGIGRGLFTLADAEACNRRMFEQLGPIVSFTGVCIAPETPDQPPIYRKPSPRYIVEMIEKHGLDPRESWMVGDSISDVTAGVNAGIRAVLISDKPEPLGIPRNVVRCGLFSDLRNVITNARFLR